MLKKVRFEQNRVYLDGHEISGVARVKFLADAEASPFVRVELTVLVDSEDIEIDAEGEVSTVKQLPDRVISGGLEGEGGGRPA